MARGRHRGVPPPPSPVCGPFGTWRQHHGAEATALPFYGPTVNSKEAAEILKTHQQTVLDLITTCVIPAGKVGRSYVMMTRDGLVYAEKVIAEGAAKRRCSAL